MTTATFTLTRGDTSPFAGVITILVNGVAVAYVLTGTEKIRFTIKRHYSDPDSKALVRVSTTGGQITFTDAGAGVIAMTISPADWAALPTLARPLRCYYDLQVSTADGVTSYTLARGAIIINPDVTLTEP